MPCGTILCTADSWGTCRAVFLAHHLCRAMGVFEARVTESLILVRHEDMSGLMKEMPSTTIAAAESGG